MGTLLNGLYGGIALPTLRDLYDRYSKTPEDERSGRQARKDWEWALCRAGPALLSAAEENERLHSLVHLIACNHDAEWGRQLARHHLGLKNPENKRSEPVG